MAVLVAAACADQGQQGRINNLDIKKSSGVIYGKDSVRNITEEKIHGSEKFKRNLKASAALVMDSDIKSAQDGSSLLNDTTVEEKYRTCSDFKMGQQMAAAFCSGLLIAPDKILTAGHCFTDSDSDAESACGSISVVFGYSKELANASVKKVEAAQIYHCSKLLQMDNYSADNGKSETDYAIFQLDRPVVGVEPVLISKMDPEAQHQIKLGDEIYTVGYPVGTPKKLARGRIRRLLATADKRAAELGVPDTEAGLSPELLDL